MQTVWMGLDPRPDCTRVLAMAGPDHVLLKARLAPSAASRAALPSLLEAIALWQGAIVRAALVVGDGDGSSPAPFARDAFGVGGALYSLEYVAALRPPRRADGIPGMGPFGDLRQLLLFEAMR